METCLSCPSTRPALAVRLVYALENEGHDVFMDAELGAVKAGGQLRDPSEPALARITAPAAARAVMATRAPRR